MKVVKCGMKDIYLKRGGGDFELSFSEFTISSQGDTSQNKIPLMGESGAGKSTFLNLMAAIEWPHKGIIKWKFPDGKEFEWGRDKPLSPDEASQLRCKYFGYAFQDCSLMPHLNVYENLCYPLRLKNYNRKQADEIIQNNFDKFLLDHEKKERDELLKRFDRRICGGQKQRFALMQAVIHNPYVLFADEPTGSLDRNTRKQVMKFLYDWVDEPEFKGKRLIIWVTHHEQDPQDAKENDGNVKKFIEVKNGTYQWQDVE